MPVLNPEIYTDVLIECLNKRNNSETLEKFMLSGQQQFQCAINNFKKAKSVEILGYSTKKVAKDVIRRYKEEKVVKVNKDYMIVTVKTGGITHKHEISYRFSMIYLVMKILASSIEEFSILSCPENFNAIAYFLEHKIKKVEVRGDLPEKYRELIASCDFIEKFSVDLNGEKACGGRLDMIPTTCRELKIKYFHRNINLNYVVKFNAKYLKNIEKLEIESRCSNSDDWISPFILNNFPKLQSFDMVVTFLDEKLFLREMCKDMMDLSLLQKLGELNISGKMIFKFDISRWWYKSFAELEQFIQDVSDIPGVTSDPEKKTFARTVEF